MKRIYLDHASATPVDSRVVAAMEPYWSGDFGNPGAIHKEGVIARKAVDDAREKIAGLLGVRSNEIVFTASATESCNIALRCAVAAWRKEHPDKRPHVIVSTIEHDAVLECARQLAETGTEVTGIGVNADGIVDIRELASAIKENTVVISVMYANNEIGTIQPIREIAAIVRRWRKEHRGTMHNRRVRGDERYPLLHTDATQAVNYLDMHMPRLGVDMLSMNAAKIYGPKGVGLLALLPDTPIVPLVHGGGHESGLRAGTENVPLIVGFAEALTMAREIAEKESVRLLKLRELAFTEITKHIPDAIVNGGTSDRLPNNVNISLPRADHEFLALALDAHGFAVSTKSACNETDADTSHVLLALRASGERPLSGIRITLGRSTTLANIRACIKMLASVRKYAL